jgi:AcrR family transcriptional regulator
MLSLETKLSTTTLHFYQKTDWMEGMKKGSARPYHHGNLRAEVLRQAETALDTVGYQNLSLRELSRALGVSHAAPRRHFADKEALLDALACSGYERLHDKMAAVAKDQKQPFETVLLKLGRAYVAFATSHVALMDLMLTRKHDEQASAELRQKAAAVYGLPIEWIARAQVAGLVVPGDPMRLALAAIAAVQGLIVISNRGKIAGIPVEVLVEEVLERVIFGLRPR